MRALAGIVLALASQASAATVARTTAEARPVPDLDAIRATWAVDRGAGRRGRIVLREL